MANGTATGYSTGDAMFKAAAETDLPRRALGSEAHGADLVSTVTTAKKTADPTPPKASGFHHADQSSTARAQWRVAAEDEAIDPHDVVLREDRERPSANEAAERSD